MTRYVGFKNKTLRTSSIKQQSSACCLSLALSLTFILCWNERSIFSGNSCLRSLSNVHSGVSSSASYLKIGRTLITLDNLSHISTPRWCLLCFEHGHWRLSGWYTTLFFDASYKSLAYKCHTNFHLHPQVQLLNFRRAWSLEPCSHAHIRLYKALCYIPLSSTLVTSDQLSTFLLNIQGNSFLWQMLAKCFHEDEVLLFMQTVIIIFRPGSPGFGKTQ